MLLGPSLRTRCAKRRMAPGNRIGIGTRTPGSRHGRAPARPRRKER
ncbi:hypothetical protein D8I24_5439 [Cupriavidus necator H850]|nr:hypothetical protein D8I24_5439 [Cupriavidus necator H850]